MIGLAPSPRPHGTAGDRHRLLGGWVLPDAGRMTAATARLRSSSEAGLKVPPHSDWGGDNEADDTAWP